MNRIDASVVAASNSTKFDIASSRFASPDDNDNNNNDDSALHSRSDMEASRRTQTLTDCKRCSVSPLFDYTQAQRVPVASASTTSPTRPGTMVRVSPENTITAAYGDGSGWIGTALRDTIVLGDSVAQTEAGRANQLSVNMIFTAINTAKNNFFPVKNCANLAVGNVNQGVLGLAYEARVKPPNQSFMTQVVQQYSAKQVALNKQPLRNEFYIQECEYAGNLYIGGYSRQHAHHHTEFEYTPITKESYYEIRMMDMSLDGQSVMPRATESLNSDGSPLNLQINGENASAAGRGVLVDTGTTMLLLPTETFNNIVTLLKQNVHFMSAFGDAFFDGKVCINALDNATPHDLNTLLPPLWITLEGGVRLKLNPVNGYLRMQENQLNGDITFCKGIGPNAAGLTILGWPVLNQYVAHFDRQNKRIGFAKSFGCQSHVETAAAPDTASTNSADSSASKTSATTPAHPQEKVFDQLMDDEARQYQLSAAASSSNAKRSTAGGATTPAASRAQAFDALDSDDLSSDANYDSESSSDDSSLDALVHEHAIRDVTVIPAYIHDPTEKITVNWRLSDAAARAARSHAQSGFASQAYSLAMFDLQSGRRVHTLSHRFVPSIAQRPSFSFTLDVEKHGHLLNSGQYVIAVSEYSTDAILTDHMLADSAVATVHSNELTIVTPQHKKSHAFRRQQQQQQQEESQVIELLAEDEQLSSLDGAEIVMHAIAQQQQQQQRVPTSDHRLARLLSQNPSATMRLNAQSGQSMQQVQQQHLEQLHVKLNPDAEVHHHTRAHDWMVWIESEIAKGWKATGEALRSSSDSSKAVQREAILLWTILLSLLVITICVVAWRVVNGYAEAEAKLRRRFVQEQIAEHESARQASLEKQLLLKRAQNLTKLV